MKPPYKTKNSWLNNEKWCKKMGITERDGLVAESFIFGCANRDHDDLAVAALAVLLAGERRRNSK